MALTTRKIKNTGDPLTDSSGAPVEGAAITFTLVNNSGSGVPTDVWDAISGERIPPLAITVITDASGEFSVNLWPNDRGDIITRYLCEVNIDGVRSFTAVLPTGVTDLPWVEFMSLGVPLSPVALQTILDQIAIATAAAATATAQADTATTQAGIATAKAVLTAADAIATVADRTQTGLDRAAATASAQTAAADAATIQAIAVALQGVDAPDSVTLTPAEVTGAILDNIGQTAAADLQLPAAAAGMNFLLICGEVNANAWRIRAAVTDKLYLNGVPGADNGYVGISVPTVGAYLSAFTFKTGAATWDWMIITGTGTWAVI